MSVRTISITEYVPMSFSPNELSTEEGEAIYRQHGDKVNVEFPSPRTQMKWQLTSRGWVGFLPITETLGLKLEPRISLSNLFRMLEYAYRLRSFHILDGLVDCASLEEFYERLANILARRVLDRARKGLYRTYIREHDRLPYIRGRLDVATAVRTPWIPELDCRFEEHTADIVDNQILACTLSCVARSGLCSERVLPAVRKAFRALVGLVSMVSVSPHECLGRFYNRLNDDYRALHALCRFFLEHSGPSHDSGDRNMLPFVVNMSRLYELFVAEWLNTNAPRTAICRPQETVSMSEGGVLDFKIDVVLYDKDLGEPKCVLDTKYKTAATPSSADVAQVATYAELKGCREAILVYPEYLQQPLSVAIGNKRVRSVSFRIDGDLDTAGSDFLSELLT